MKTKNITDSRIKLWRHREKSSMLFNEKGTFNSYHAAKKWLTENGYSYGSMQRDAPIGIVKGDCLIEKWRNIEDFELAELDGVMVSNDFREGAVEIVLFQPATPQE